MVGDNFSFDSMIISSLAITLAAKYLVGAVMSLLSGTVSTVLLLGTEPVTIVVGLVLALSAGGLAAGHGWARWVAVLGFLAVLALGHPTLSAPEPVLIAESSVTLIATLYLFVRDPLSRHDRSVDDDTSASRIGSTLR